MVRRMDVEFGDAKVRLRQGMLDVTFLRDGGYVEAAVGVLCLPADWRAYGFAELSVVNGGSALKLEFAVLCARGRIMDTVRLRPFQRATIRLRLADMPLAQGVRPSWEPAAVRIKAQWGRTWRTEGELVLAGKRWPATDSNKPVTVRLCGISLLPRRSDGVRAVVDRFGQRIRGRWRGKIHSDGDLRKLAKKEAYELKKAMGPAHRNRFGGWTGGVRFDASGFFRIEQDGGGRWWFVDPDGCPFWSFGTTCVRLWERTSVTGREDLFEELPDEDGRFGQVYRGEAGTYGVATGTKAVQFYCLNVLRKWGSPARWLDVVVGRYRSWGFNTIGNWSQEMVLRQKAVPHTVALNSRLKGLPLIAQRFPDVWCREWERRFRDEVDANTEVEKGNPWLIGYFCDNELPWGRMVEGGVLESGPDSAFRAMLVDELKAGYGSLRTFNSEWGADCRKWDDLRRLGTERARPGTGAERFVRDFMGKYAERYFSIVEDAIRRSDPDHLYLGCRFVRSRPVSEICRAAGRHSKLVTVNCYSAYPEEREFGAWHRFTGRPILIGEFHWPLLCERQLPPIYPAFTAKERCGMLYDFVRRWSERPYSLGCHWFQFSDQHLLGRPSDGENQVIGFVDVADTPYGDMVRTARMAAGRMYGWHANAPVGSGRGKL